MASSVIDKKTWLQFAKRVVMPEVTAYIQNPYTCHCPFIWMRKREKPQDVAEKYYFNDKTDMETQIEKELTPDVKGTILVVRSSPDDPYLGRWRYREGSSEPDYSVACHVAHPDFRRRQRLFVAAVYVGPEGHHNCAGFESVRANLESRYMRLLSERGVV